MVNVSSSIWSGVPEKFFREIRWYHLALRSAHSKKLWWCRYRNRIEILNHHSQRHDISSDQVENRGADRSTWPKYHHKICGCRHYVKKDTRFEAKPLKPLKTVGLKHTKAIELALKIEVRWQYWWSWNIFRGLSYGLSAFLPRGEHSNCRHLSTQGLPRSNRNDNSLLQLIHSYRYRYTKKFFHYQNSYIWKWTMW